MYVLVIMFVTLPTFQEERSPLKSIALWNTALTDTKKGPIRKMGRKTNI